MLKVSSFCSGIGSPEFAINELSKELGFDYENVFAAEIDKYARASYLAMHKVKLMINDMTVPDYVGDEYYSDINISGLPCQSFSLAGLRKGELDPRGLLFYDFYRYVKVQRPKAFVIENVKGLLSDAGGKTFQNWLLMLGDSVNGHIQIFNHELSLGYNLHWTVLNTKDFGLPQNRERVFIVGIRLDIPNTFRFPVGFPLKLRLKDILEPVVDEKYYLSEKRINSFINHKKRHDEKGTGFAFNPKTENDIASCIRANAALASTDNIIKEINNSDTLTRFGNSQDMKLSSVNGVSQTLSSGHFNQPNIILKQVGKIEGFESRGRIYDESGLSPTLDTCQWGNHQPIIKVTEATKKGYAEAKEGDSINLSVPESKTRRGRVGIGIANTLDMACNQAVVVKGGAIRGRNLENTKSRIAGEPTQQTIEINDNPDISNVLSTVQKDNVVVENHGYRIRRLLPIECFRLQGFSDEAFYKAKNEAIINSNKIDLKGMSDSRLYKQAGNSISTPVIKAILKNILKCILP
jgi:DNA (cytosine-5)-methyltransferase 1